jgi:hypothetical protein
MSLCTLCGQPTCGADALCTYHSSSHGDDWATGNRIMCDFLHRGIVVAAPPPCARRALDVTLDSLELERLLPVQQARTIRQFAADARSVHADRSPEPIVARFA